MRIRYGRLAALAGILTLAGCEATVSPPPADPGLCPNVYQPVCVRLDDGRRQTFPNACTAVAEGHQGYAPGACETPKPDRICPNIYQPVCGEIGGRLSTYTNDCVAGASGARVVRRGPC